MAHAWGAFLCGVCVWNDDYVGALSLQPTPVEVRETPNVT